MGLATYEIVLMSIGLLPFAIIAIAGLVLLIIFVFRRLALTDIAEILLSVGTIWLIVIFVLLFVGVMCASIQVREQFSDDGKQGADDSKQGADDGKQGADDGKQGADVTKEELAAVEQKVCTLMASVDSYITNDVGLPGQDNPSVLEKAKQTARGSGTLPECDLTPAVIEDRISRMERALTNFTGPELKKTYDKTIPCTEEGFASFGDRLTVLKASIDSQTNQYLKPIQQKEIDTKAGRLSDCDKKRAAKAAVVPS